MTDMSRLCGLASSEPAASCEKQCNYIISLLWNKKKWKYSHLWEVLSTPAFKLSETILSAASSRRFSERLIHKRVWKGWWLGDVSHYCSDIPHLSHCSSSERLGEMSQCSQTTWNWELQPPFTKETTSRETERTDWLPLYGTCCSKTPLKNVFRHKSLLLIGMINS